MKFIQITKASIPGTAYLTLNNPGFRNMINPEMFSELDQAIEELEKDITCRIIIVRGNGKSFCMGFDLPAFIQSHSSAFTKEDKDNKLYMLITGLQKTFLKIYESKNIYIASMHRHVYGAGLDLVTFCDIRIASETAKFCLAETNLGILADLGSLNLLPSLIGESNARYMALTGDVFSAGRCREMGLVNDVVPDKDLENATLKLAKSLSEKPGTILQEVKLSMNILKTKNLADGLKYLAIRNVPLLNNESFLEKILKK